MLACRILPAGLRRRCAHPGQPHGDRGGPEDYNWLDANAETEYADTAPRRARPRRPDGRDARRARVNDVNETRARLDSSLDSVVNTCSRRSSTAAQAFSAVATQLAADGLIDQSRWCRSSTPRSSPSTGSLRSSSTPSSPRTCSNAFKAVVIRATGKPPGLLLRDDHGRAPRVPRLATRPRDRWCRRVGSGWIRHKSELNAPGRYEARLDYDLNDPCPDAQGDPTDRRRLRLHQHVRPANRIRTVSWCAPEKVAHINGIKPETQARFAFIFGYTTGAREMLFGPAMNPDPTFDYYSWADEEDGAPSALGSSARPSSPSHHSVASTALRMVVEYAEDMSVMNLDLADRQADVAGRRRLQQPGQRTPRKRSVQVPAGRLAQQVAHDQPQHAASTAWARRSASRATVGRTGEFPVDSEAADQSDSAEDWHRRADPVASSTVSSGPMGEGNVALLQALLAGPRGGTEAGQSGAHVARV